MNALETALFTPTLLEKVELITLKILFVALILQSGLLLSLLSLYMLILWPNMLIKHQVVFVVVENKKSGCSDVTKALAKAKPNEPSHSLSFSYC